MTADVIFWGLLNLVIIVALYWEGPYTKEIPRDRPGRYMTRRSLRYMAPDGGGPWRIYLQQFHGPDDEGHHNHPARWSFSLVLWGSYTEERLHADVIGTHTETRRVRWFNFLRSQAYHRITALHPRRPGGSVWTLFFVGPTQLDADGNEPAGWGFWIPGRGHVDFRVRKAERELAAGK
jgi:hypothetical protein